MNEHEERVQAAHSRGAMILLAFIITLFMFICAMMGAFHAVIYNGAAMIQGTESVEATVHKVEYRTFRSQTMGKERRPVLVTFRTKGELIEATIHLHESHPILKRLRDGESLFQTKLIYIHNWPTVVRLPGGTWGS